MPPASRPRNYRLVTRAHRRRWLLRALWVGFLVQQGLVFAALHAAAALRLPLSHFSGYGLLAAATVVLTLPSLLGGALTGLLYPGVRPHQLATFGALAGFLFLSSLTPGARGLPQILQGYLAFQMVLAPAIGGTLAACLARRRPAPPPEDAERADAW